MIQCYHSLSCSHWLLPLLRLLLVSCRQPPSHAPFLISSRAIIIPRSCCSSMPIKSSKSRAAEKMTRVNALLRASHSLCSVSLGTSLTLIVTREDVRELPRAKTISLEVYLCTQSKILHYFHRSHFFPIQRNLLRGTCFLF